MRRIILSAILIGPAVLALAQITDDIAGYVTLDSVVVLAKQDGFEQDDFIRWMEEDTSLYAAFRRLRTMDFVFTVDWDGSYLKGKRPAQYAARCRQIMDPPCRKMLIEEESHSGPVYKKDHSVRYYTLATLMDLFYTPTPVCSGGGQPHPNTGKSTRINQLKEIIFNPGSGQSMPFIGKKFELFSDRMRTWYQYAWYPQTVDGEQCFVFAIRLHDKAPKNKAVIQSMVTYFRKGDRQVLYRSYHLKHQGLVIFETKIQISVRQNDHGQNYPARINYSGIWNIPGKRGESGQFQLHIMPAT